MLHFPRVPSATLCVAAMLVACTTTVAEDQSSADIDSYFREFQAQNNVQPAPAAAVSEYLRRVTLDLAGRIPTRSEWEQVRDQAEPTSAWREKVVEQLLNSPDFEFHQRNELDRLLMGAYGSDNDFREYLLRAVRDNRTWDRIFSDVMIGRDDHPEEKGATAFLRRRIRDLDNLTNDTSSLFFGVSINCAQCHDHPLVFEWTQAHYFGLSSFFNRSYSTRTNVLAEKAFGDVKYKTTAGEERQAELMFLTGTVVPEPQLDWSEERRKEAEDEVRRHQQNDVDSPPSAPPFSRRMMLVDVALRPGENRFFARAMVNRMWARLLGVGLVMPLDQLHAENLGEHSELLDGLADDFIASGYDLKLLMRQIVLSDVYARSSRWDSDATERPAADVFAVAEVKPLSARQLALSLQVASTHPSRLADAQSGTGWANTRKSLESSAEGFARKLDDPTTNFEVSVAEALLFSNNDQLPSNFLRDGGDRLVGYLAAAESTDVACAEMFAVCLCREPAPEEVAAVVAYLRSREGAGAAGLQQAAWALLSSSEFRFNH